MSQSLYEKISHFVQIDDKSQFIRLFLNLIISISGSLCLYKIMPKFKEMFIRADLKGTDMSKKERVVMYLFCFINSKLKNQIIF
jgi:hypothetical protein